MLHFLDTLVNQLVVFDDQVEGEVCDGIAGVKLE